MFHNEYIAIGFGNASNVSERKYYVGLKYDLTLLYKLLVLLQESHWHFGPVTQQRLTGFK